MSDLIIKRTCPLGHTCRKVVDDHIEECMWFTKIVGNDPQTGEHIDRQECAIVWQPILMVENSSQIRGMTATMQGIRSENFAGALAIAKHVVQIKEVSDAHKTIENN